jgi:hypothetical protein
MYWLRQSKEVKEKIDAMDVNDLALTNIKKSLRRDRISGRATKWYSRDRKAGDDLGRRQMCVRCPKQPIKCDNSDIPPRSNQTKAQIEDDLLHAAPVREELSDDLRNQRHGSGPMGSRASAEKSHAPMVTGAYRAGRRRGIKLHIQSINIRNSASP